MWITQQREHSVSQLTTPHDSCKSVRGDLSAGNQTHINSQPWTCWYMIWATQWLTKTPSQKLHPFLSSFLSFFLQINSYLKSPTMQHYPTNLWGTEKEAMSHNFKNCDHQMQGRIFAYFSLQGNSFQKVHLKGKLWVNAGGSSGPAVWKHHIP